LPIIFKETQEPMHVMCVPSWKSLSPEVIHLITSHPSSSCRNGARHSTPAHCSVGSTLQLLHAAASGNAYWWPTWRLLVLHWMQDRPTSWLTDMTERQTIP